MKTRSLVFAATLLLALPLFAVAAEPAETPAVIEKTAPAIAPLGRTELKLRVTPAVMTRVGMLDIDITEIVQTGNDVVGKIKQYIKGFDGCSLTGRESVVGTFDGTTLFLRVNVPDDDKFACRHSFELKKGTDEKFEGLLNGKAVTKER